MNWERFTSFDGVGLAYATTGDGPVVALLHGFAADSEVNWVAPGVVDALASAGRRVVTLDARGHGLSDKPHEPEAYEHDAMARDAGALLDHLGVEYADVVGYSMGSIVTLRLAPREPRARSLVLGGVGGRIASGRRPIDSERVAAALVADDLSGFDPASRAFRRFADRTGADRLALAAVQQAHRREAAAHLGEIGVPTLVLAGAGDALAGSPDDLAARIPGAVARTIAGDHLSAVYDPGFRDAIVEFLAGVERRDQ